MRRLGLVREIALRVLRPVTDRVAHVEELDRVDLYLGLAGLGADRERDLFFRVEQSVAKALEHRAALPKAQRRPALLRFACERDGFAHPLAREDRDFVD